MATDLKAYEQHTWSECNQIVLAWEADWFKHYAANRVCCAVTPNDIKWCLETAAGNFVHFIDAICFSDPRDAVMFKVMRA